jgi:hypothetical protein
VVLTEVMVLLFIAMEKTIKYNSDYIPLLMGNFYVAVTDSLSITTASKT